MFGVTGLLKSRRLAFCKSGFWFGNKPKRRATHRCRKDGRAPKPNRKPSFSHTPMNTRRLKRVPVQSSGLNVRAFIRIDHCRLDLVRRDERQPSSLRPGEQCQPKNIRSPKRRSFFARGNDGCRKNLPSYGKCLEAQSRFPLLDHASWNGAKTCFAERAAGTEALWRRCARRSNGWVTADIAKSHNAKQGP